MAASSPHSSFLATRRGKLTLALLCAVAFLDFVDASIVNVALPSIRRDLHFSVQSLVWVPSGYLLTYGGVMLLRGPAPRLVRGPPLLRARPGRVCGPSPGRALRRPRALPRPAPVASARPLARAGAVRPLVRGAADRSARRRTPPPRRLRSLRRAPGLPAPPAADLPDRGSRVLQRHPAYRL